KVDTQGMEAFSDTGFGSDIGILYSSAIDKDSSYRAGLVVKNLIEPMVKMSAVSDTIPRQYIIAGNYSRAIDRDIKTSVFLDLYMPVGIDFVFKAGAEGKFFNIFSVRTGYDSYGIFSVGAGAEIADLGAIDYGFFITGLDITHRVSVKARFGGSVSAIRAEKERLDRERIEKRARMLAAEELKSLREKIDNMTGEARKKEYFKAVHYAKGLENYFDGNLKLALIEFETVAQVDIEYMNTRYYLGMIKGVLGQEKEQLYDKEIIRLYREGVSKYVKEDYAGAKKEWEAILKIDPYNRLALENLKEVNSILRNLEEQK
ncbi:MAG TPA: conjugal transfer protein TraF, partial [Candidatus Goldiibacteriota bacterium]|nr:conjugal transfer protein TraF [Candidatus Goldiibacteriota bacterium]